MRKAKVTVPAASTNLGPGIESLGLALNLYVTATFIERNDTRLVIDSSGEDIATLSPDCLHPVMYAAVRVFQRLENGPLGLRIHVENSIPLGVGLGGRAAMTVAGLIGANNLMDMPLGRDQLVALGTELLGHADGLVTAMLGGLTVSAAGGESVLYRRLELGKRPQVVVAVPRLPEYGPDRIVRPLIVDLPDAVHNLGRVALVVDALRTGDFDLLAQALDDRLLRAQFSKRIPGFDAAVYAAREAGAAAVTVC
ncbi:MAG: homoserine kinase, partial [Anaerolineae bacterium]|nr:homoserine kinase [Anaerolineae bacterium]